MEFNYRLRSLRIEDTALLHRMCWPEQSFDAVHEWLMRTLSLVGQRRVVSLVAELMNTKVVFAYGQVTHWPHAAEISDLIVAPQWRSRGVGAALIYALTKQARDWNVEQVEIGVTQSNSRALALYQRLGFIEHRALTLDLGRGLEPVLYLTMPSKQK